MTIETKLISCALEDLDATDRSINSDRAAEFLYSYIKMRFRT